MICPQNWDAPGKTFFIKIITRPIPVKFCDIRLWDRGTLPCTFSCTMLLITFSFYLVNGRPCDFFFTLHLSVFDFISFKDVTFLSPALDDILSPFAVWYKEENRCLALVARIPLPSSILCSYLVHFHSRARNKTLNFRKKIFWAQKLKRFLYFLIVSETELSSSNIKKNPHSF